MTDLTPPVPARPGPIPPMPFTMLLDEAMRRARRHFRALYLPVAIPLALLAAATGVLQAFSLQHIMNEAGAGKPPAMFSFTGVLMGMAHGFILMIGLMALQKAAVDAVAGRMIDMKAAWRFAVRPAVLGTLVLQFLAIMASTMACFVPALYVAPLLSLVAAAMADEGVLGSTALSRSAELTRYNPQNRFFDAPLVKALALMLVTVLISYAVGLLVVLPLQIPMFIAMFRQIASGSAPVLGNMAKWMWIQIPSQVLQTLATIAVYIFSSFGYALLFFDARARKEGSDLAAEIDTVFGPGTPAGEPAP
jgi:hypothetical protein